MTDIGSWWEQEFARRVGGELIPGSGNKWYAKLDAKDAKLLWSCKATDFKTYPVTKADLDEARRAVLAPGGIGPDYLPALAIHTSQCEFVAMAMPVFMQMVTEPVRYVRPSKIDTRRARSKIPQLFRNEEWDGRQPS